MTSDQKVKAIAPDRLERENRLGWPVCFSRCECFAVYLVVLLIAVGCTGDSGDQEGQLLSDWKQFRHEVRGGDNELRGLSEHAFRFVPKDSMGTGEQSYVCEWHCKFTNSGSVGYGGPVIYGLFDEEGSEVGRDSAFTGAIWAGASATVRGRFPVSLAEAQAAHEARWWFTCGGQVMDLRCVEPEAVEEGRSGQ